jgi:sugar lactone lactonase YvrE
MKRRKPELALKAGADLAEGPWWDVRNQELLWVDIFAGEIHRFNPSDGSDSSMNVGQPVGMTAARKSGGLVCAVRDGIGLIEPGGTVMSLAAEIEKSRTQNRMNDGACDPMGRLWAGTMATDLSAGEGALYRISAGFAAHRAIAGVSISNGLDWSPDGRTFYFIDSPKCRIDAYDFDRDSGEIGNGRILAQIPHPAATPDGMAVDSEGTLWVAMWDGAGIHRYSPDGRLLETIDMPVSRVTSVAFGGSGMDQLFITTARHGLSPQQMASEPLAGSILALDVGVAGLPPYEFAG